jgi:uncharacterized protein YjbI with pentapeptide repeats
VPSNLSVFLIFIAAAIIIWLLVPFTLSLFSKIFRLNEVEIKDEYQKLIRQVLAGGTVLLGVVVQLCQSFQTWISYESSQSNLQLENGFRGLQSADSLGRVSGINYLTVLLNETLIEPTINYESLGKKPCDLPPGSRYSLKTEMTLRALSSAATIFSKRDDMQANTLINVEAREALRVVAHVPGDKIFFDMRGGHFRGAPIPYACLASADLTGANFEGANLYRANVHGAELKGVKFSGANLAGVDSSDADIKQAIFTDGPNFSDRKLKRVNITRTELNSARFYSATMNMADFTSAHLPSAFFNDSTWERVIFEKACLFNTHFRNADISLSSFIGSDARCAVFSPEPKYKTRLHHVDFSGADLSGADFRRVELSEAIYHGANLSNANFEGAVVEEKSIEGAYLCNATWKDGKTRNDHCGNTWKQPAVFLQCPKNDDRESKKVFISCKISAHMPD